MHHKGPPAQSESISKDRPLGGRGDGNCETGNLIRDYPGLISGTALAGDEYQGAGRVAGLADALRVAGLLKWVATGHGGGQLTACSDVDPGGQITRDRSARIRTPRLGPSGSARVRRSAVACASGMAGEA
jgi:hypothetical protein